MSFQRHGWTFERLTSSDGRRTLEVCPQRGGLVTSLRFDDQELLYLEESTLTDASKNVRGGIPLLFPICGPLREPGYQVGDKQFQMRQHGFARNRDFSVQRENEALVLTLRDSPETLEQFPYRFELSMRLSLEGVGFDCRTTVVNHDHQELPYQWGTHPYFQVADLGQVEVEVAAEWQRDNTLSNRPQMPYSGQAPHTVGEVDREYPHSGPHRSAILHDKAAQRRLRLGYDESFDFIVVWSLPSKKYLCLEPWTGPRFGFQDGQCCRLQPGQSATHHYWLELV